MANQDYRYIQTYYGVPARRGAPVKFDGRLGKVTAADGAYVRIKFDDEEKASHLNYHPTWKIEWLEQSKPAPAEDDQSWVDTGKTLQPEVAS